MSILNYKFLQYQLWLDCSNNCRFCMNRLEKDVVDKKESIDFYIQKIKEGELKDFTELGIIGGEFFNGQLETKEIHDKFYEFIGLVADHIKEGIIKKFDFTTSLIFKDLSEIYEFLDFINKKCGSLDALLLCTSYDTIYRFHNQKGLELWENAIFSLHEKYPTLKIHVETILTQDFINKVLSGEHDIKAFAKKYNVHVDYIAPLTDHHGSSRFEVAKILPDFYPTRDSFFAFMQKVSEEKTVDLKALGSREIMSHTLYALVNGKPKKYIDKEKDLKEIGGIPTSIGYVDDNTPINYDIMAFRSLLNA